MSPLIVIALLVLSTLLLGLYDLAILRMAFRAAASGGTMRLTLSSRASLHYQAADGGPPAERPHAAGDQPAESEALDFATFAELTYAPVRKIIAAKFNGSGDAEEAVHDVYATMLEQWAEHSLKDPDHLRGYIVRAVSRKMIDRARREKSAASAIGAYLLDQTTSSASKPGEADLGAPLRRALRDALRAQLAETRTKTHRRIVELHFTTELTAREIARVTKTSERTVHRVVRKAKEELTDRLERNHPEVKDVLRSEARRRLPRLRRTSVHDKEVDQ